MEDVQKEKDAEKDHRPIPTSPPPCTSMSRHGKSHVIRRLPHHATRPAAGAGKPVFDIFQVYFCRCFSFLFAGDLVGDTM